MWEAGTGFWKPSPQPGGEPAGARTARKCGLGGAALPLRPRFAAPGATCLPPGAATVRVPLEPRPWRARFPPRVDKGVPSPQQVCSCVKGTLDPRLCGECKLTAP